MPIVTTLRVVRDALRAWATAEPHSTEPSSEVIVLLMVAEGAMTVSPRDRAQYLTSEADPESTRHIPLHTLRFLPMPIFIDCSSKQSNFACEHKGCAATPETQMG